VSQYEEIPAMNKRVASRRVRMAMAGGGTPPPPPRTMMGPPPGGGQDTSSGWYETEVAGLW